MMAEERPGERIKTNDVASSSSSPGSECYQVFLSFRGKDTRKNFTDHLYWNLMGAGVRTFRDDEELRVGEEIWPDLMRAIEQSSISIPIFSRGYASSKWCLRELAHMVNCALKSKSNGHTIFPIFYDVPPSDVRHQSGSFADAFIRHKDQFDEPTVKEWKEALKQVADLKGWEKDEFEDGHEGKLVDEIVKVVCMKLKKSNVNLPGVLVGMDRHIEIMTNLLDIDSGRDVRIVGIVGMGGIGKTTIAKFMYNQLCDHFQRQCSFLENVTENVERKGYDGLQYQLMSDVLKRSVALDISSACRSKKVLIVLDDITKRSQLDKIIGSLEYFGSGSRIIVTTRDKDVFHKSEVELVYEPSGMDSDDSLVLFCKFAFKSSQPVEGYEEISKEVASTAGGLPLSLVVIGSSLFAKEMKTWKATLKKLKALPPGEVQASLKISYDALEHRQKQMFLDIACHFIGKDITNAIYMWDACDFFPESDEGIDVLVSRSLITIVKQGEYVGVTYTDLKYSGEKETDVFRMHDQLRDMGRNIVYLENPDVPEKRSRLSRQEAVDTLINQSGTENVRTLHIEYEYSSRGPSCFSSHDFKEMTKLRYLYLEGLDLEGDFDRVFRQLRWLRWHDRRDFDIDSPMALTNFCHRKLAVLDLSHCSVISHNSEIWKSLRKLKVLNLSYCDGLTKTPNFSALRSLERLILEGCSNLTEIGSSIKHLKRLTYFNAKQCYDLRKLPLEFGSMAALKQVYLDCYFFREGQRISELPESIGLLTQLQCLSLKGCALTKIPESLWDFKLEGEVPGRTGRLSSLTVLNLSFTEVDWLPDDIGSLCNLRVLDLSYNGRLKKLPGVGIERLKQLQVLDCTKCTSLEGQLPEEIWSLSSLIVLKLRSTKLTGVLPKDISGLTNLETLDLEDCMNLRLPTENLELPVSLTTLAVPLTEASRDSVTSLVNLKILSF